jgi:hypothetical protein
MDLIIRPPEPRYKIVTLTLPGHSEPLLEVGPVLAATYNQQDFEVIYPFRAVVRPLTWLMHRTYGAMPSPDAAIWRFMKDKQAAVAMLSQDFDRQYGEDRGFVYPSDGAVSLEIPPRRRETIELLERVVS